VAHASDPTQAGPVDPSDFADAEAAFSRLFEAAFRRVHRFAHARLSDPRAVERVTADVLECIVAQRAELLQADALWRELLTRLLARIREETAGHDVGSVEAPRAGAVREAIQG
jgi:hypothetical protein